ncbi:hypothetical protein OKW41_003199 [Paraburkholderia sp. UCT70]
MESDVSKHTVLHVDKQPRPLSYACNVFIAPLLRCASNDHYAWRYGLETRKDKAWHFLASDDG